MAVTTGSRLLYPYCTVRVHSTGVDSRLLPGADQYVGKAYQQSPDSRGSTGTTGPEGYGTGMYCTSTGIASRARVEHLDQVQVR